MHLTQLAGTVNIFKYDYTSISMNGFRDYDSKIDPSLMNKLARFGDLNDREFLIVTSSQGYFRGSIFRFRAPSSNERDLWLESLILIIRWTPNGIILEHISNMRLLQLRCRQFYEGNVSQLITAGLITASFVITIAETQAQPADGTTAAAIFYVIGELFNWIFTVELLFNFYCTFLLDFIRDGWNWFDTFVVASRFLLSSLVGGAQVLRCVRAVRVFRLFKRIPALLRLIRALATSMPRVLNAFALVLILQSIYAILAVQFFADAPAEDGCGDEGACPGELFGSFGRAFFTMFQIATLDAWSDVSRRR